MSQQAGGDKCWDVFLSYASEDREQLVAPLVMALRRCGLSVWYDQIDGHLDDDALTDDRMERMLEEAMSQAQQALIVLSERFIEKRWPRAELAYLLRRSEQSGDAPGAVSTVISRESGPALTARLVQLGYEPERLLRQAIDVSKGPHAVAQAMVDRFAPRSLLRMRDYVPPVDIAVFESTGKVIVGHSGGLFRGGELDVIDLSGRTLSPPKFKRVLEAFPSEFEAEERLSADFIKQFDQPIKYAHVSHLHQRIFKPDEVERGSAFNFGTNEDPLVLYPFYACDSYTGGVITHEPDDLTLQCLAIAAGSWEGDWRRLIVGEGTFHVEGEG